MGSRRRAEALARLLHTEQDLGSVRETLLVLPLSYCYAFVNQWLWSRVEARRLVQTCGFSSPDPLRNALAGADNAMICLVGVQVPLLLRYFSGQRFVGVHRVNFAGGRFPQESLSSLRDLFPAAAIFNNYGCTEAMPRLTLRRAEDGGTAADIGRPLPGVELRTEADGGLSFRSVYGAVGVVDDRGFSRIGPEDWVPTGDIGAPGEDGRWMLAGRASDVFKRYGEKVSIANILSSVSSVWSGQAAAYRESDRSGENGYVLVVSPAPTQEQVTDILVHFRETYPRAFWPLRLESVRESPTLPSGKIDAAALAASPEKTELWHQRI